MVFVKGACYYFNVAQKVRSNCSQRPRLAAVAHIEFNERRSPEASGSDVSYFKRQRRRAEPCQQTDVMRPCS
jgi:hypothetical protein